MSPVTASVVGIPSKTTWSSTASLKLDGIDVWLSCSFAGNENAPHEGRRFIKFLEGIEEPDFANIYSSIEEYFSQHVQETVFSLSCICKKDHSLLILTRGFGVLGFVRNEKIKWLADGEKEAVVLQGELQDDDFFFLATARGKDVQPVDQVIEKADPDQLVAQLFSLVQRHEEGGEMAFLFVKQEKILGKREKREERALPENTHGPKHLISPSRIEQALLASQEEQKTAMKSEKKRNVLLDWKENTLKNIHWIRAFLVIGVFLAVIIGLFIYRTMSVRGEYLQVIVPLMLLSDEVQSVPAENIQEKREKSESLLKRLESTKITYNTNKRRLDELTQEVRTLASSISGEKNVVNLPVYYDFRLVQADFLASRGTREKGQSVFLDSAGKNIMNLDLLQKRHEKNTFSTLNSPKDITLSNGTTYFLDGNVVQSLPLRATEPEILTTLSSEGEYAFLEAFGDNLYVVDKEKQQIWRLAQEKDASPSSWVRSARGVDFSKITSLTINGSLWLGTSDGEIYKLTRGERENFSPLGLAEPFTSTLLLAANAEGENLAVVEPAQQRLVVLNKDGTYKLQVISENIGAVTDIFLSEDEKSVYLIAGSIVYLVEIEK